MGERARVGQCDLRRHCVVRENRTVIIAVTANGDDPGCQSNCRKAGMDGVLTKPLTLVALHELLLQLGYFRG